jgi:hypothetical protein
MSMRRAIMQLSRFRMIFVMRSVVISCRHIYGVSICPDLLWASFASLYA